MSRALSIAELANLAAETEDQTETQTAGEYEREVPATGAHVARFVEYIETGKHKQKPFQGKAKPDAEEVRITFELLHPKKSIIEYEHDGVKKVRGQLISIKVTKSLSDKASFKKLFNAMTYGRDGIKHMAQMLGEPFLVHVVRNVSKDAAGKEVTYANLNKDGVFLIGAPQHVDPMTEVVTKLPVREPIAPVRIFLWNNPTKETWDSLFIDGTRTVKNADGTETEQSKNWLQEKIMSATDFNGSPLHALLNNVGDLPLDETPVANSAPVGTSKGGANSAAPAQTNRAAVKQNTTPASPSNSADDALAALGLVG
jgi:hypothetical protein